MGQGTLTIYSASAGSGKTFNLAGQYLSLLFKARYNYRRILAVTFTNKATAEMKNRILDQLQNIAEGSDSEYLPDLMKNTGKSKEVIQKEAGDILFSILHDFSRFSVSTIDTFFQKILRAFTREAGLHSGFNIELDHSIILAQAVDEMIASSTGDPSLENWLNAFVMANLEEEKSWNLKREILKLSEELFREKFRILSAEERLNLENKEFLLGYIKKMKELKHSFEARMTTLGKECEKIFNEYELTDDMFYQKGKGIPSFVRSLAAGEPVAPNDNVREIQKEPPRWSTKQPSPQLLKAIEAGLGNLLNEAIRYFDSHCLNYNSAKAVLKNIFTLGILSDISGKVHKITTETNTFLLSDAGELLSYITREDQTPFIYEKIGNSFENYMIDEFQDTSLLQWANFEPLVSESMSRGNDNLIVGDIKQSIYRFRNSDWQILAEMQDKLVDNKRVFRKPLKTNWRSRSEIIKFNNSLFSLIAELTVKNGAEELLPPGLEKLYAEAIQGDPLKRKGGYVRLEFISDEKETGDDTEKKGKKRIIRSWEDVVLEKLPSVIELIQDKGYNASDIGIIVRDGREGESVLERVIEYSNSTAPEMKSRYNYNIVSSDSLSLSGLPAISFIISVLKVIHSPEDFISRAAMVRFFLLAKGIHGAEQASLSKDSLKNYSPDLLPDGSESFLAEARQLPIFEAVESIIEFFGLGSDPFNVAYLCTFQDYVLTFGGGINTSIQTFLEWWETTGYKKSVALPATRDALRILTIHKSKGLEFKVVIIPFISWNLDHISLHYPVLWVKPNATPFNDLKIVPVKYSKNLQDTIFADDYKQEKSSVYIDNINLLYVALTRARDAMFCFAPMEPTGNQAIAKVIFNAVTSEINKAGDSGFAPATRFNKKTNVFETGEIPVNKTHDPVNSDIISREYLVNRKTGSLRLKLHGENYFLQSNKEPARKINYGKLMHEIFEAIGSSVEIDAAVRKMVLDGRITDIEAAPLIDRLKSLVSELPVSDWFKPSAKVMKEAAILLPDGSTRRPDRVIIEGDSAIVIDFKFGEVRRDHSEQVKTYCRLIQEMGFRKTSGFLWYVDINKIIPA